MAVGNKFALLVGCNDSNNPNLPEGNRPHGCRNDVYTMQDLIRHRFGFTDDKITILTDEPGTEKRPTFYNIIEELKTKANATMPGDTLLFFFSGGGELVNPTAMDTATATATASDTATAAVTITATATATARATKSATATTTATASPTSTVTGTSTPTATATATHTATNDTKKGIPAIIPCDLLPITAAHLLPIINPLPDKAIFFFICDSSYSGGLFKENVQIQSNVPDPGPNFRRKTIPSNLLGPSNVGGKSTAGSSLNAKILISSSKGNEESVEVNTNGVESKEFGVLSNFIHALTSLEGGNPCVPAFGIIGFFQHPYLDFLGNEA